MIFSSALKTIVITSGIMVLLSPGQADAQSQKPIPGKDPFSSWLKRGRAEESGMDDEAALLSYNHALALKPNSAYALLLRSKVYANLQKRPEAEADLLKAIEACGNLKAKTTPGAIDTNAATSLASLMRLDAKYDQAIELLDKVYDRSGDITALLLKAEIENDQKRYAAALKTVNLALKSRPENARGMEAKAQSLMHLGNLEGAEKLYTDAIKITENNRQSQTPRTLWKLHSERAKIYKMMGKDDLAKQDLQAVSSGRDMLYDFTPFRTKTGETALRRSKPSSQ